MNKIIKSGVSFIAVWGLIALVWGCAGFRQPPIGETVYWNLRSPLSVIIPGEHDPRKDRGYTAFLRLSDKTVVLSNVKQVIGETNMRLELAYPPDAPAVLDPAAQVVIQANRRNRSLARIPVIQDSDLPYVSLLAYSPSIRRGGSALVIFQCNDENLKRVRIRDNWGNLYFPQEFRKEGYYICLVGWFVKSKKYRAWVEATDEAGNVSRKDIPFKEKYINYPVSQVNVRRDFIAQKSKELGIAADKKGKSKMEQYRVVTQAMSQQNKKSVWEITRVRPEETITNLKWKEFQPLKKSRVTSGYGQVRSYIYNKKSVKKSYHLGIDLAWDKRVPIYSGNRGEVVFSGYNGGYGNTLVVHHGMGLYSLYSHCSRLLFPEGSKVKRGDVIARSGSTGYATGDHLHFSLVIQGVYVDPREWMDEDWIEKNIDDVINRAVKKMTRSLES